MSFLNYDPTVQCELDDQREREGRREVGMGRKVERKEERKEERRKGKGWRND